jgi:hypothetical protein
MLIPTGPAQTQRAVEIDASPKIPKELGRVTSTVVTLELHASMLIATSADMAVIGAPRRANVNITLATETTASPAPGVTSKRRVAYAQVIDFNGGQGWN